MLRLHQRTQTNKPTSNHPCTTTNCRFIYRTKNRIKWMHCLAHSIFKMSLNQFLVLGLLHVFISRYRNTAVTPPPPTTISPLILSPSYLCCCAIEFVRHCLRFQSQSFFHRRAPINHGISQEQQQRRRRRRRRQRRETESHRTQNHTKQPTSERTTSKGNFSSHSSRSAVRIDCIKMRFDGTIMHSCCCCCVYANEQQQHHQKHN